MSKEVQPPMVGGYGFGELIAPQKKGFKLCQSTQLQWDAPLELVHVEVEILQFRAVAQFMRDDSGELGIVEREYAKIGKGSDAGRDGAR